MRRPTKKHTSRDSATIPNHPVSVKQYKSDEMLSAEDLLEFYILFRPPTLWELLRIAARSEQIRIEDKK